MTNSERKMISQKGHCIGVCASEEKNPLFLGASCQKTEIQGKKKKGSNSARSGRGQFGTDKTKEGDKWLDGEKSEFQCNIVRKPFHVERDDHVPECSRRTLNMKFVFFFNLFVASADMASQNHRMVWVARDPKDNRIPSPLPWAGPPSTWGTTTISNRFPKNVLTTAGGHLALPQLSLPSVSKTNLLLHIFS